jgi:type VI secretion system protein ImpH
MAGTTGPTTDSLIERLKAEPYGFDFLHAVRLLQSQNADRPRIGHSLSPSQDPVRFAQSPSLDFAPATLEAVQQKDPARPPVLYSRHFGLFGPNGPLPTVLTEFARDRILHHGDRTFVAFCNIFHHRLLSFFFRAWADSQRPVDLDRPGNQRWIYYVGSLIGLGMETLLDRDAVPDWSKLYYAGRLVSQTRNAEGLEAIIQDFFGIPTEVQSFVGRWLALPPGSECKLGDSPETGSLGVTTVVGSRVWDCQLNFRLRMGPMKLADLERLLPSGHSFKRLRDWILNYAGEHYFWDAQLVLAREEVPEIQLGRAGRLGWTTWLKTKPFSHDAEDLILQPPLN